MSQLNVEGDDHYIDLFDFLDYIHLKWLPKNKTLKKNDIPKYLTLNLINESLTNNIINTQTDQISFYEKWPVALIQLLILLLVFFVFLFMCKCNKIMESCKGNNKSNQPKLFDEDQYKDQYKLKDYIYHIWNNFKLNHCRRRRKRRFKSRKRNKNNSHGYHHHQDFKLNIKTEYKYRNNSIIFRRKSVIYRNSRSNKNNNKIIYSLPEQKSVIVKTENKTFPVIQTVNERARTIIQNIEETEEIYL